VQRSWVTPVQTAESCIESMLACRNSSMKRAFAVSVIAGLDPAIHQSS
jgi:hypothetical protein